MKVLLAALPNALFGTVIFATCMLMSLYFPLLQQTTLIECRILSTSGAGAAAVVNLECNDRARTQLAIASDRWAPEWDGPHTAGSIFRAVPVANGPAEYFPTAKYCTSEFKRRAREWENTRSQLPAHVENFIASYCGELMRQGPSAGEDDLFSDDRLVKP
jgi:hypothetical protein